jgi:metal-responsive CopG/Arc/MetJ family transcriptional regulator
MARLKKICLYFDMDLYEELKKLSAKIGAPVSELIRRAVKKQIGNNTWKK